MVGLSTYRTSCNGFVDERSQLLPRSVSRMPSPVGHALGGLAAAFVVDALARRPRLTLPLLGAAVAFALSPDLDLLAGSHRTYTHSLGAVAIVAVACWLALRVFCTKYTSRAALCTVAERPGGSAGNGKSRCAQLS